MTNSHLETPFIPAQAGIRFFDFFGLRRRAERRNEDISRCSNKSALSKALAFLASLLLPAMLAHAQAQTPSAAMLGQAALPLSMSPSLAAPSAVTVPPTLPAPRPAVASAVPASAPQSFDYSANLQSEVFGANLFSGAFTREGASRFNPDYQLQIGDTVNVRLWGAFNFEAPLTVDPQGNLFMPYIGPVKALGVANQDLQKLLEAAVRRVYRNNVFVYASLAAAQPVRVYVGGYVNRPGLYDGTSLDSLLRFLDQAGGIDPARGSFLRVEVKRGNTVRATVNFYDFMLEGRMPLVQLANGDVIFVAPRQNTVKVSGLAENAKRFEFADLKGYTVAKLIRLAKPQAQATHVRVVRNTGTVRNVEYYPLGEASQVALQNGDEVEFTADKKPGTITVRVEGEHVSPQEYVLPYGAKLGELMRNIQYLPSADAANLQLHRQSVRDRQKQMLAAALKSLETSVLTARSATNEESRLRKDEAELMLQWVDRAKKVEPSGQVIVAQAGQRDELLLENGDVIRVPKHDGLVLVSGEVVFPNAVAFESEHGVQDYIKLAGGYSQSANTSRIIVAHRDGSYGEVSGGGWRWFGNGGNDVTIQPGDEILVLPKIQTKSIEVTRGITQIIYQIAIAAKVILDL